MIPFAMLKHFRDVKRELAKLTGSDSEYYRILGEAGYRKSSEIVSQEQGWAILALLREQLAEVRYKVEEAAAIREFGGG